MPSVIRTFSLALPLHARLERFLDGDRRDLLRARMADTVGGLEAPPPGTDSLGLRPEDYVSLRQIAGIPQEVVLPPPNLAHFGAVVSPHLTAKNLDAFNAAYKNLRADNRSRAGLSLRARRVTSVSRMVEELLTIAMDTLEERAARSAENGEASTKTQSNRSTQSGGSKTQGPSNSRRKSGDARKGKDKPTHTGARALTTA